MKKSAFASILLFSATFSSIPADAATCYDGDGNPFYCNVQLTTPSQNPDQGVPLFGGEGVGQKPKNGSFYANPEDVKSGWVSGKYLWRKIFPKKTKDGYLNIR